MVDEEARADLRARVDVDAGRRVGDFIDESRQQRHAQLVQRMREPVMHHRQHAGVAQQDLGDVLRGRIACIGRLDIADEQRADRRQLPAEFARDFERAFVELREWRIGMLGQERQRTADLFGQNAQRAFERVADVEVDAFVGQIRCAVVRRKHRRAQAGHNLADCIARRQFANAARMARAMEFLARLAQAGNDFFKAPLTGG